MAFIKKLFSSPIFEDEEKTHQAYLLNTILLALIIPPIPYLIYILIRPVQESDRALMFILIAEIINIIPFIMLRNGYVRSASLIQIITLWLFFAYISVTAAGIYGIAYILGNSLVITIAGILLGGRGALLMTLMAAIEGAVMVHAESRGWIPPDILDEPLPTWIVIVVLFVVTGTLQQLSSRTLRFALRRARESEEKYRLISQVSTDYVFSSKVDKEGNADLSWVAGAFEKMTGYTFEEYIARGGWLGHVHPDDIEKDAHDMEMLHKNQDIRSDIRTFAKNGEIRWERIFAHPIWDEKENRLVGIIGAVQDVTEQKRTELALAREKDVLQIFMDNIPDTVYFKDTESRFVRINQAQARFLGIENPQEAIGKTDLDFQEPERAQKFMAEEKRIIATGEAVMNRMEFNEGKDGKHIWLSSTKVPVKDRDGYVIGIIGISRDVTEQKQAQENLTETLLQQSAILNNIPDAAWLKDKEGHYIAVNEQFYRFTNLIGSEVIGKTDLDLSPENIAKSYREGDIAVMNSKQRLMIEEPLTDQNGEPFWVETVKTPIFNSAGEVVGTTGISHDITERKHAEMREQRRQTMLEKVIGLGKIVTEADNLRSTVSKIWHGVHDDLGFDRLAIFLYNAERNTMDDTFGTNQYGEMIDVWHLSFPVTDEFSEAVTFLNVLEKPDGLYFTLDYTTTHKIPEDHEMYGVKEFAAVAVWAGNKPVAVICVDHLVTKRPITPEQLEALRLFAGYAGLAIENARLNEALQKELSQQIQAKEKEENRRAILEKIVGLGQRMTEVSGLRVTLTRIWQGIHDDLGFDRVGLYLYNPERSSMDGTFGTNHQGEMIDEWHTSVNMKEDVQEAQSFLRVMEKPDTVYFTQTFEQDHNTPAGHIMSGVKNFAAIAAWAGDKPVAVICVDNVVTGRPITDEQLEALRLFAGYAGLAVENAYLNEALQKELSQKKDFIQELESKNAELERFTYTVSHDLKSPLVTIKGFLGYLERDAQHGNFDKFRHDIQRIETAVGKMQNLLKDLLELSRIGRIMNTPVEVAFEEIVKDALEIVHGQALAKNVLIEFYNNNKIIKCDRIRIVEVLQNLIDNAIKFMGEQPRPKVEIGSFENEGETVFYVRDNGVGISPDFQENIFGLFNKLNADSEGTGIGLALVKRIIEVHGGRIWLESKVGSGTTFYFTLS